MKQVEVFKTSVCEATEAQKLIRFLLRRFPHYQINFDLEDCDRILRIETSINDIDERQIRQIVTELGYECFSLPG